MKTKFILLLTLVCTKYCLSQDLNYSQFYETPLLRNPALAGLFDCNFRIASSHRSQWSSVTVPFVTTALDIQYKFPILNYNDFLTIGTQITYDQAGDVKLKRTQILPVVNFHKSLNGDIDEYISLGFMTGPVNSQFNSTLAKLDDQFVNGSYNQTNPTMQVFSNTGYTYWDASFGAIYSKTFNTDSRFYGGVAVHHFNKPRMKFHSNNSQEYLLPRIVLNGGINVPSGDENRLFGFTDFSIQGGNRVIVGGALYEWVVRNSNDDDKTAITLGAMYRWNDAIIPIVKLNHQHWQIGLSYDMNVSKLSSASGARGGFEISAAFLGCLGLVGQDMKQTLCPKF